MSNSAATPTISNNPMGYAPINSLLLKLGIPMMISMLVQALYNVVDSIFVSFVSEDALSAVGLAFPAQNLMISFGVGTAVGVNALLSKSLGEKEFERASRAAGNGLFLSAVTCAAFVLFGLFGVDAFIGSQTTDPVIHQYGVEYLTICSVFSAGLFCQTMCEKLLVATGRSSLAMTSQLVGAVANIILDPIFIFGLFGVPAMGAKGAAVATVMGQFMGGGLSLYLNFAKNKEITISREYLRPDRHIILRIYRVGAPSIAMQSIGSVMTFCFNKILMAFSSTAVAVFNVYFKLQSFVFMPVFGLNNAMVPLISYNYGARNPDRISQTIKTSMIYATSIMVIGFLLFQFAPQILLSIFNASPDMLALGIPALRLISFSFLLAGHNIICSSTFQALGKGMLALWASVARQLVVLVPVAWALAQLGQIDLVWLSFPIAEIVSLTLCQIFLRSCYRKIIRPLREEAARPEI